MYVNCPASFAVDVSVTDAYSLIRQMIFVESLCCGIALG